MNKFCSLFTNSKFLFCFGLVLAIAVTSLEFLHDGAENYIDYRDATHNFWNGISSYTREYVEAHGRYFIYSPIFCILFTPFAYLPFILGGFAWNILGYCLFWISLKMLPESLSKKSSVIFLYLLLIVGQSLFCFQYNLLVSGIFLLAFALLERGKPFPAILLIMLSATTKIYGIVELALLFCYPKFWRNLGYAALCGGILLLTPAVKTGFTGLIPCYLDWFGMLTDHHESIGVYYSLIFARPIRCMALPYMRFFQAGVLAILAILFFRCRYRWQEYDFRIGVLATLMIYIVLMSEAAEFTTHTISATGYALWYFNRKEHSTADKIFLWAFFVLFIVMPIDIFCPESVCLFFHTELWLGVWIFTAIWLRVIYTTFTPSSQNKSAGQ